MGYNYQYGNPYDQQQPQQPTTMPLSQQNNGQNMSPIAMAKVFQGSNMFPVNNYTPTQFSGGYYSDMANTALQNVASRNNMKASMENNRIISDLVKTQMANQAEIQRQQMVNQSDMAKALLQSRDQNKQLDILKQSNMLDNQAKYRNYTVDLAKLNLERDLKNREFNASIAQAQAQAQNEYGSNLIKFSENFKNGIPDGQDEFAQNVYNRLNNYFSKPTQVKPQPQPMQQPIQKLTPQQEQSAWSDIVRDFKLDPHKSYVDNNGFVDIGGGRKINVYDYWNKKYGSQ